MAGLSQVKIKSEFALLRQSLRAELEKKAKPLSENGAKRRLKKSETSLLEFMRVYLPHYLPRRNYSKFHIEFSGLVEPVGANDKGQAGVRLAIAAPRSNGKTTLLKALILWAIVFEKKSFVVVISDALDQAVELLEAVKFELEENPRIAADCPKITGVGSTWSSGQIVTKNQIKVKAYGTGKRIRGASFGVKRPDLIILDDLENDEQVQSERGRDQLYGWFWKSVVPLGPPDQSHDIITVGTLLHYDSVLSRLLDHPGFEAKKFSALINWPIRMDLWEEFESLYWKEGKKIALCYYQNRQKEMGRGAEVLWPKVQTLEDLMIKWTENRAAFNSEMLNEPLDLKERIFSNFHTYDSLAEGMAFYGAIDPAMGSKSKSGDPTAIIILAQDQKGFLYVVEAIIQRLNPDESIEVLINLQVRYGCVKWAVETVQFQEFFKSELLKRAGERGIAFPATGVKPHMDKNLRIQSLQPPIKNGQILFKKGMTQLLDQLSQFPKARHDDGPDALHMAYVASQNFTGEKMLSKAANKINLNHYQAPQGFSGY